MAEAGDIPEGEVIGILEVEVDTRDTQGVRLQEAGVDTQGVKVHTWQLKGTMGSQRVKRLMMLHMETLLTGPLHR